MIPRPTPAPAHVIEAKWIIYIYVCVLCPSHNKCPVVQNAKMLYHGFALSPKARQVCAYIYH